MASEMLFRSFPSYKYGRNLYFLSGNEVFCWVCACMHVSPFSTVCISVCGMWVCTLWSTVQATYIWRCQLRERKGFKMDESASFWIPAQLPLQQKCMEGCSLPSNPTFLLLSSLTVSHLALLFWTVWGELFCWRTDRQNAMSHYIITFQCSVGVERLTRTAMSSRRILAHRF